MSTLFWLKRNENESLICNIDEIASLKYSIQHLYQVRWLSINVYVSYSADTSMCTLTFKYLV